MHRVAKMIPTKCFFTTHQIEPDDVIFILDGHHIYLTNDNKIPTGLIIKTQLENNAHFYCFAAINTVRYLIAENIDENALHSLHSLHLLVKTPIKQTYHLFDETLFRLAKQANHLFHWRKTHAYCGQCGNPNQNKTDEQALICPHCHHVTYPRISPCIIVLVTNKEKLLLARSPHFSENTYSTLAGFIEPGESLEQAIHREIYEEVGIIVKNITYFGSQPWPFPDSLMMGFFTEYVSGEIVVDGIEIEDAKWFDRHALPNLPSKASIARELIETYIKRI